MSVLNYIFVPDTITLVGRVVRKELVVPPGNRHLGIGCHIIQAPDGREYAVPNMRIDLSRHLGKRIWYCTRKHPMFEGVDYRVASSSDKPNLEPLYEEYEDTKP